MWRLALLGGLALGLGASPYLAAPAFSIAAPVVSLGAIALVRRRRSAWTHFALVVLLAALAGLMVGSARLRAIDAGAFDGQPGRTVTLRGYTTDVPRRSDGVVRVRVDTAAGTLLVEAHEPQPDLPVGAEIEATGVIRAPEPWLASYLRVRGVSRVVRARDLTLTGARRGGVAGLLDGIRSRAEAALERGIPPAEAALARGFVLGQDDRISPLTADEFRRSGLSHLLAVSGQNVVLLSALAVPLLALLGASLRARLIWVLVLIAVYVPVAGGGPSIQRAGVMGAAAVIAVLASRPRSRVYALLLAALVTLALNPRSSEDVGWQLSFAAVIGIGIWARPLAAAARSLFRCRERPGLSPRAAVAEGFGITAAATLATLPLIAQHFEVVQVASLPANLLALPAVAPVMWLGMLVAFLGQLPVVPVEPLNALSALLIAYLEQVARWCASAELSQLPVAAPQWPALAAMYATVAAAIALATRLARRRRGMRVRTTPSGRRPRTFHVGVALIVIGLGALGTILLVRPSSDQPAEKPRFSVSFFDVGQGDAILLDPPGADPVLVDGGPPGTGLLGELDQAGGEPLAAILLTHSQLDHYGGVVEILGERPVGALLHSGRAGQAGAAAAAAGVPSRRIAAGDVLRFGELRLQVLWPPEGTADPGADPNLRSLVFLARWRRFSLLLTGDAEAEVAPIDPGPVDVIKIAHHGSEDAGLPGLLARAQPLLAVISVGAENSYGHPSGETLEALAEAEVPVLRTDEDGEIGLAVNPSDWIAIPEG